MPENELGASGARDVREVPEIACALAIESSTRHPSLALLTGGRVLERRLDGGRSHASDLLAVLRDALREAGTRPAQLEALVVGTGPGSFTGLRVGIATALGLARASGAVLRAVPSVEALALQELEPGRAGSLLLDARGGALYFARYRRTDDDVEELHAPCVVHPDELADVLPDGEVILGDENVARAARLNESQRARLRTDATPRAGRLLEMGLARLRQQGPSAESELEPLYLRPFAARPRKR